LKPNTCYRVDVRLVGEEINEKMNSIPAVSRAASRPMSRSSIIGQNHGGVGGGAQVGGDNGQGIQEGMLFGHVATVRTDANNDPSSKLCSLFGMAICVTHDGLGRASIDQRSPSFIETLARHSAVQFGNVFSAHAEEVKHYKRTHVERKGIKGVEEEEEELRRQEVKNAGCKAPPWHMSLHLGGQIEGRGIFLKVHARLFLF